MLTLNSNNIVSLGMPVEWREFTRYFSGFPLSSLDQEVVCYHKKQMGKKQWKDIGSRQIVFLCREKEDLRSDHEAFFVLCSQEWQLMIRDGVIQGMQVHIPLTGERMGKEENYAQMVRDLWNQHYIVVQTIIQTKDFPLIQWSITDPALLQQIVQQSDMGKEKKNDIHIGAVDRRNMTIEMLTNWCEENGYKTDILDDYDIALIECDAS